MALNYSHRPVFPAHISEENLVSPVRIVNGYLVEDVAEKNGEAYSRPWHMSRGEAEDRNFSCGRERVDRCSSSESTSKDIVDLLPSDPFGMDIKTTFTAITGWLEDLEVDCGGYMRPNNFRASQEGYDLFAGWNLIWNNSLKFQPFPSTSQLNEKMNVGMQSVPSNLQYGKYIYGGDRNESDSCDSELQSGKKVEGAANFEGVPHEALAFALSYLGVKDLLSVERVCKSLLSTVRGDPLLWMTIHIDQPLNERITDDVLVQLASRAQGNLQCLSLVECPKITDDGLRHILETNPRLSKLLFVIDVKFLSLFSVCWSFDIISYATSIMHADFSTCINHVIVMQLCVPGCTRISIECIVNSMRAYNCNKDVGGIKHLRIGGLYGVNHEHFEELKLLLGADQKKLGSHHKPHFYHRGNFYLPYDDDRAIDIEMCPRCEKFRLVYDCPAEGCRGKDKSPQVCRGCTLCIARCAQCGRCINDTEFEETFCLELLCSDCFKQLQKYQDKLDKKLDQYGAQHGPSYHFGLHG
ncbi:UNVERIFIED_CONTAM: F-box protein SKIP14 [Sesamum radiatum]|uniref:F-box protein SKIP14 n=1 Tax=Sesamum radiatum TaxID=300843 RepID=A0AAW2N000_SESRA